MKRGAALLIAMAFASTFAVLGSSVAADCGEDGTAPNPSGSCETADNQVRCGDGTEAGGATFSYSDNGGEVCNEDADLPIQGRAGADGDCLCLYADGEEDNNADLLLNGWARVDQDGVWCADRNADGNQSYTGEGQPIQGCAN